METARASDLDCHRQSASYGICPKWHSQQRSRSRAAGPRTGGRPPPGTLAPAEQRSEHAADHALARARLVKIRVPARMICCSCRARARAACCSARRCLAASRSASRCCRAISRASAGRRGRRPPASSASAPPSHPPAPFHHQRPHAPPPELRCGLRRSRLRRRGLRRSRSAAWIRAVMISCALWRSTVAAYFACRAPAATRRLERRRIQRGHRAIRRDQPRRGERRRHPSRRQHGHQRLADAERR